MHLDIWESDREHAFGKMGTFASFSHKHHKLYAHMVLNNKVECALDNKLNMYDFPCMQFQNVT